MSAGFLLRINMRNGSSATSHTDPVFVDSIIHKLDDLCARRYFYFRVDNSNFLSTFSWPLLIPSAPIWRFDPEIQWPDCGSCGSVYTRTLFSLHCHGNRLSVFYFHCALSQKSMAHT